MSDTLPHHYKYLVSSPHDVEWGITVNTVGKESVPPGYRTYPPRSGHPDSFYFTPSGGRCLDSYQLLYITHGRGSFYTSPDVCVPIKEGDMLILQPHKWHSYFPDRRTGWQEYWIGFNGDIMKMRFSKDIIEKDIFRIGVREDIVDMFIKAISVAEREQPMYQNVLACTAEMILTMTLYYDKNNPTNTNQQSKSIRQAQAIIRENLTTDITPEDIARQINMSYSWFRKSFKDYTGISPVHYMLSLRIKKAKELLAETDMSIKEIAYRLNFDSPDYFSSKFKAKIGCKPSEYRARMRSY